MGPLIWSLRTVFEGVLGTLKGLYRVYSRYIRIPGLRARTSRNPNPKPYTYTLEPVSPQGEPSPEPQTCRP